MRFTRHHLRSGNCTPILACPDYANFHVAVPIALMGSWRFSAALSVPRMAHPASLRPSKMSRSQYLRRRTNFQRLSKGPEMESRSRRWER